MAGQEKYTRQHRLEETAKQLYTEGNILGALETLDEVINIEKCWYHLYIKVCWLYDLPEKDFETMWKIVEEALLRFPGHLFWFLYLRADLRCQAIIHLTYSGLQTLEDSLFQLSEAQKDIESAFSELRKNPKRVQTVLDNPPLLLPPTWHRNEIEDVFRKLYDLKQKIDWVQHIVATQKTINDTETRINEKIAKQKNEMHADKMRTIEILGFFTAIMAFIILSGNAVLNATFKEAMPVLGVLSLVLILFVTVTSLVTSKFNKRRYILGDVRFLVASFLIIILGLLVLVSQRQKQNTDITLPVKPQPQVEMTENE